MTQKIKQIIVAVVIIIVAFLGFKMFFAPSESGDTTLTAEQSQASEFAEGQVILALLAKLNRVTLDRAVFSDKVFASLVSFEQPIADQIIGRQNPFLPIGKDGSGVILLQSSTTSQPR